MKKIMGILLLPCVILHSDSTSTTAIAPSSLPHGLQLTINVENKLIDGHKSTINQRVEQTAAPTPLLNGIHTALTNPFQVTQASSGFFNRNIWYLVGGTVLGSYATICYFLIRGNYYLGQTDLWSNWRAELSMEHLLAIPQDQLTHDLLREIHRRYSNDTTITDMVTPLSSFVNNIAEEEQNIRWYQELYSWIHYFHAVGAFPVHKARFAKINERLQRLVYYKNLFQTWSANYKMDQILQGKDNYRMLKFNSFMIRAIERTNIGNSRIIQGYFLKKKLFILPSYS